MENPSHVISKNLKKIRNENGLSLDAVSKLTGVSKGMLGQIEREEVNPTITTILKIANGLNISFTSLLSEKEADVKTVELKKVSPIYDDTQKWRSYPLFTFEDSRPFEIYHVEADSGMVMSSEGHIKNSEETITVYEGELTLSIEENTYTIPKGNSIRFKADVPHKYENNGSEMTKMHMIIYYPK
ncbi:XRE family transcriptional regulator [Methanococcus maripaludis]|uniref:helix-turn-helix domain-containing protein n=1 Tax=Methanococcus maripaludis TaxID=39152 RepID=UPI002FD928F0